MSYIIADTNELCTSVYQEGKNKNGLYKCIVLADTNVAETVTPFHSFLPFFKFTLNSCIVIYILFLMEKNMHI